MKTGCDRCDAQGPEPTEFFEAALALHRAMHDLGRAILEPYERLLHRAATLTKRGN